MEQFHKNINFIMKGLGYTNTSGKLLIILSQKKMVKIS